jgi:hypothetical protein
MASEVLMTCRLLLAAALVLGLASPGAAQPSVSAQLAPGLESLAASGGGADTQQNVSGSLDVEHRFASERARLFYDLEAGTYSTPGDWRYFLHTAGGSYRLDLGRAQRHRLFLGADTTFRRNGDAWTAADYNALGSFANLELRPRPTVTVRSGYRFDLRRFADFAALDQEQHSGFGSLLVNLQTRTTLIGEVSLGAKRYAAVPSATVYTASLVSSAPAGGTPASGGTPGGSPTTGGPGSGGPGMGGPGMGGPTAPGGGSPGGLANLMVTPVVIPGTPSTSAQQFTVFGRVAQSLAARTGLSVEASHRRVFGEVPPALVATPARFFDDGVYDDPFASRATLVRATLRSIVGYGIELVGSGSWQDKPYGATPALADTGYPLGVLRHDKVARGLAGLTVPLFPSHTGPIGLDLVASYDITSHRSTTAAYNYTSHALGIGVSFSY